MIGYIIAGIGFLFVAYCIGFAAGINFAEWKYEEWTHARDAEEK